MAKRQIFVSDDTLNLVEFRQMSGIQIFVSENAVDGKQLGGLEAVLSQLVKHPRGPENKLIGTLQWCAFA